MTTENWMEERGRLREQVARLESGEADHFDDGQTGSLGTDTTADQIARMKDRLSELDVRLDQQ
ncbi:MAG: hypothetical protein ABIO43_03260 [Sphingomicrobium sp.]